MTMEKRIGLEGSAASRMIQLMRQHGYNKDVDFEVGEILAPFPNIKISVGTGDDKIELDKYDLIIAEHLTEHTRKIDFSGSVSGVVSPSGSLTNLTIADGVLTIKSALKVGDKVIISSVNDSQIYYVIDKAVIL